MSPIFFLFILAVAYYIRKFYQNVKGYPSGPMPIPFLGNLLSIDYNKMHEYFHEQSLIYGPVFTVWMPRPFVIITDYKLIKEALGSDDITGRSQAYPEATLRRNENSGILFSDGEVWRDQRRVSVHILRDFGMGKAIMERMIHTSVEEFLEGMKTYEAKGILDFYQPVQRTVKLAVANVINELLFGFSYTHKNSERLFKFVDCLNEVSEKVRSSSVVGIIQAFPWLMKVPYFKTQSDKIINVVMDKVYPMVDEDVANALKDYDVQTEPSCFVQAYAQKMAPGTNGNLNMAQLVDVTLDFVIAGMETTTTTTRWGLLYLAENQAIQDQIREEIFTVIGTERLATMNDKINMPYTTAAIAEIQRCANLLHVNLIHRTTRDTVVGKEFIPENTLVIGQLYEVLRYSTVFDEAEKFSPERFLESDGKTLKKNVLDQMVAFSVGKRQCAGESLARMELFILITAIFQNYKVLPLEDEPIDLTPIIGFTATPKPNQLRIIPLRSQ